MTFQRLHAAVSLSSALSRDDDWYVCSGLLCKRGGATGPSPQKPNAASKGQIQDLASQEKPVFACRFVGLKCYQEGRHSPPPAPPSSATLAQACPFEWPASMQMSAFTAATLKWPAPHHPCVHVCGWALAVHTGLATGIHFCKAYQKHNSGGGVGG